jgi:magnesium chelatase family protein
MALARTRSVALVGVDAHLIDVEVDVGQGVPEFTLTALSDRVLGQVKHRVRSAITNSGEKWPLRRTTVSLSPATVPKSGSRFDLAVAATLLAAAEALPAERLRSWVVIGELDLAGRVRAVNGVLPSVIGAYRAGARQFVVPRANLGEARLVSDAVVAGVGSLRELCAWLRDEAPLAEEEPEQPLGDPTGAEPPDFADVLGQETARHAMEVAAAGGHHVLMLGPPGVGKTMLAERLPGILPDLSDDEALEVTGLHSVAGRLHPGAPLITRPPFCAPHHTATVAAIVGGGTGLAAPGAVSLANHGVLFLDEAPLFSPRVLDALREPLESGLVTLARAGGVVTYPARFQLVLAANPCPCSAAGQDATLAACSCPSATARAYQAKLSGAFRDRLDLVIELLPVSRAMIVDSGVLGPRSVGSGAESSASIRARVLAARERSAARLAGTPWSTNAQVPGPVLRRRWPVAPGAGRPLRRVVEAGVLSNRGVDRVLKVSWTLADLAGRDQPSADDVRLALSLRAGRAVAEIAAGWAVSA